MAATWRVACCRLTVAARAVAPARAVLAARCMVVAAVAAIWGAAAGIAGIAGRGAAAGFAGIAGRGAAAGIAGRGGPIIVLDAPIDGILGDISIAGVLGGMRRGVGTGEYIAGAGGTGV